MGLLMSKSLIMYIILYYITLYYIILNIILLYHIILYGILILAGKVSAMFFFSTICLIMIPMTNTSLGLVAQPASSISCKLIMTPINVC